MNSGSPSPSSQKSFFDLRHFPTVTNGRINVVKFMEASCDLICVIERLGKTFAPVRYDLQGNIDKINKHYKFDETSCLLELMLEEINNGTPIAAEGILWLNRALLFIEMMFQEILSHLRSNNNTVNMSKIYTVAYEGSLKKYHNWVTQQIFALICKMSPTLPQVMQSLGVHRDDVKTFELKLDNFIVTLHLVRCKIDDFFIDHNIFDHSK